ncbi:hypothetical protein BJY04DRAFT_220182 [Aspergillus karnatakaensis]|uniref:uncharacterized protein n=1 Tax=Aspergillus karnatakaensis TaxID=1810916 RepID=UPI003CCD5EEF
MPSVLNQFEAPGPSNCLYRRIVLHDVEAEVINKDITTFFRSSFMRLRANISESLMPRLVDKAGGLFIWADTAVKFIASHRSLAQKRLKDVLSTRSSTSGPEKKLDEIYTLVLQTSICPSPAPDEKTLLCRVLRNMLGFLAVLFLEFPPAQLYALLGSELEDFEGVNVHESLKSLSTILDVPESPDDEKTPFRLHHPSLRDFLLDPNRCKDKRFLINNEEVH